MRNSTFRRLREAALNENVSPGAPKRRLHSGISVWTYSKGSTSLPSRYAPPCSPSTTPWKMVLEMFAESKNTIPTRSSSSAKLTKSTLPIATVTSASSPAAVRLTPVTAERSVFFAASEKMFAFFASVNGSISVLILPGTRV